MRIVVRDKRYYSGRRKYILDVNIDYKSILSNLPLTNKVLEQYEKTKSAIGYATFRGLELKDIKSILSAVKRQKARVNVDRFGNCAYYKLLKTGGK